MNSAGVLLFNDTDLFEDGVALECACFLLIVYPNFVLVHFLI